MRVLHVVPSVAADRGGPTEVLVRLAAGQSRRGHEVRVVACHDGRVEGQREAEVALAMGGVALRRARVVGPAQLEVAPRLLRLLDQELRRAQLVHLHTVFTFPVALPALLCRRRGLPYLVRPAGTLDADCLALASSRRKRLAIAAYVRDNLDGAAAVQATSDKEAEELRRLAPRAKVVVLPPGAAAPPGVPVDAGGRGEAVGFLGRLHPAKQLEVLIDAFARLAGGPALLLGGSGEPGYVAGLRARAAERGVAERVHFLGQLDEAGKAALLARCQVLAFPSLHESFGLAVAEAMAAGRAVVVSPGVALATEIAAADAGRVAPAEAQALAQALAALLDDGAERARMAERARALAAARYSWDAAVDATLALYQRLLDGR